MVIALQVQKGCKLTNRLIYVDLTLFSIFLIFLLIGKKGLLTVPGLRMHRQNFHLMKHTVFFKVSWPDFENAPFGPLSFRHNSVKFDINSNV